MPDEAAPRTVFTRNAFLVILLWIFALVLIVIGMLVGSSGTGIGAAFDALDWWTGAGYVAAVAFAASLVIRWTRPADPPR